MLGASGQVGTALQRSAPNGAVILAPSSSTADFRKPQQLRDVVVASKADVIINCAAFTRVDDAETETAEAYAINSEMPQLLAELSVKHGARLLHISTDYVFDGSGLPPYNTLAPTAPLSVYGASKLAGEHAVLSANPDAAVVRTAWVHAGAGVNFVATAVRVLSKGTVMRVVDDQVSTPTRAASLAQLLWLLAEHREHKGLLHFTDAGVASWYDVAVCVVETLQRAGRAGEGAGVLPVDSSAFPRPAKRPRVSLLDKHATWNATGFTPPHWRDGVMASTNELIHA